jgi:serine/threonine protein kinase
MGELIERCDFRAGDKIDHKYYVEKMLGEGAFGKVFKVILDRTRNVYALKLLKLWEVPSEIRQQLKDRFQMEFETGQIPSNYLVHSVDYGYSYGNPYIIMEFCSGGDLLQLVNHGNPDLVKIARHVLYGLKDLHKRGKVHRDLKPENVLIKEDGKAVLTDFGISGDRNKRMTERNIWGKPAQIFGTYGYMPPEQVRPDKDATVLPTTDIFSFGVMMYQLITAELPFGHLNNEDDLVRYIKNGREGNWNRAILDRTTQGKLFARAIEGCLHPNFKQRLQTVDNVLSLLPNPSSYPSYNEMNIDRSLEMNVVNGILLRIMQGEEYGKAYKLNELIINRNNIVTMGRRDFDVSNVIPITEEQSCYISRKHCTMEFDSIQNRWYIRDGQWDRNATNGWKKSLNGTYINSMEVSQNGMPISPGDIISIGDVKLRVEGY